MVEGGVAEDGAVVAAQGDVWLVQIHKGGRREQKGYGEECYQVHGALL